MGNARSHQGENEWQRKKSEQEKNTYNISPPKNM